MIKDMKELNKIFLKLSDIYQPKALDELQSHMLSIYRKMEDLINSRNNWKKKYLDLKKVKRGNKRK